MLKDLVWCFIIYLLYRLIFQFIVPIAKTIFKMKQVVNNMQKQQQDQQASFRKEEPQSTKSTSSQSSASSRAGTTNINAEYIDFEEVKE